MEKRDSSLRVEVDLGGVWHLLSESWGSIEQAEKYIRSRSFGGYDADRTVRIVVVTTVTTTEVFDTYVNGAASWERKN